MKIIITGATGMVGSEVVRQAILDGDITEITTLVRKPLDIQHPKLKTIIHKNFLDYSNLAQVFKNHNACLWCLGISQSLVSKEQYHVITFDYALAGAVAMLQSNPSSSFLFLSGAGADQKEKSRTLFARVKGKTENALLKLPFRKFFIARPGAIKPIHPNRNAPWYEKLVIPLFPLLKLIVPSLVITSEELAKAMLQIIKRGGEKIIFENAEMKQLLKNSQ